MPGVLELERLKSDWLELDDVLEELRVGGETVEEVRVGGEGKTESRFKELVEVVDSGLGSSLMTLELEKGLMLRRKVQRFLLLLLLDDLEEDDSETAAASLRWFRVSREVYFS